MSRFIRDTVQRVLAREHDPYQLFARYIVSKLESAGVRTTAADVARISSAARRSSEAPTGTIGLPLSKGRLAKHGITLDDVSSWLSDDSFETWATEYLERVALRMPDAAVAAAKSLGDLFMRELRTSGPARLAERREQRQVFEGHLHKVWGKGFDLLDTLIEVARDIGEAVDRNWRAHSRRRPSERMHLLHHLHARACRIGAEVVTLLRAGFASGAMGRWRALHEVAVVATLISKNDETLAKRYIAHSAVTRHQSAVAYSEHSKHLGLRELPARTLVRLAAAKGKALQTYGRDFGASHGWASELLGSPATRFSDLEVLAQMHHLRPYYKWASQSTHATTQGTLEPEGLRHKDRILLAGPSNYGLADPGQLTADSIAAVCRSSMAAQPSLESVSLQGIAERIASSCAQELIKSHRAVEALARKDDAKTRRRRARTRSMPPNPR